MRINDRIKETKALSEMIYKFRDTHDAKGVDTEAEVLSLAEQVIDSKRRVDFVLRVKNKTMKSDDLFTPGSGSFNPIKGASVLYNKGMIEEACWLIFLVSHFNKNSHDGWGSIEKIYSSDGLGSNLTWDYYSKNKLSVDHWLKSNIGSMNLRFGNHRKYESTKVGSNSCTLRVFDSYYNMVNDHGSHQKLFESVYKISENDPKISFKILYEKFFTKIFRFGRTAKFDHLCLLGKLGIADIEPGEIFVAGATGPKAGINLLMSGEKSNILSKNEANNAFNQLASYLKLDDFAMQVLEDAICNWQKSPDKYVKFNG